jgi:CubicO group peptidase (beta-lactamase class C family)
MDGTGASGNLKHDHVLKVPKPIIYTYFYMMTRKLSLKSRSIMLLTAVTLLSCMSSAAFAQAEKAEAEITAMMKEMKAVGISVAVVKGEDIVYTHSFGLKNIEQNTPLSDNDIFRIASISKSFSATSIMQLRDAGKLSVDDDFSKLVGFTVRNPKYPEKVITLKMVLSHRSSINDSQGYFNLDVINPARNPDYAKCYNNYEPDSKWQYCNLNYNMVGAVIERISGERFDRYVKKHILDPLGLYGGYNVDSLDAGRFVTLYEYDSLSTRFRAAPMAYVSRSEELKNYVMGYSTPLFSPTGGMKITATDLAKYMTMHMHHGTYKGVKIISKKSSKLMQKKISEEEGYAMAMMNYGDLIPGKVMVGHNGSAYGLYSAMFFDPKEKFGIVVITNGALPTYVKDFREVLRKAVNILYQDLVR